MTEADYQELLAQVKLLQRQEVAHRLRYGTLVPEGVQLVAKRPLPKPEVLSPCKDQSLPKRPPMGQRPAPVAEELNKQRQRPVYDEKRD